MYIWTNHTPGIHTNMASNVPVKTFIKIKKKIQTGFED